MSNFPSNALAFMECVGKLKVTKRTGWVRSGIQLPESIADHMYRMSMMSWMIADPSVNREKLMKMCMVHDLAESIVGDYTPHCKISREEKFVLEETAFKKIMEDLAPLETSQEMFSLWQEFENGNCIEADIARQLDKLEMIIQADEYERQQGVRLQDFFDSTATAFSHPEVVALANEVRVRRERRLNQSGDALEAAAAVTEDSAPSST